MEFIENMAVGIGAAVVIVAVLTILFWFPVVAALGIIASGIIAIVYFASGQRYARAFEVAKGLAWLSMAFAAISVAGHVLMKLSR